MCSHLLTKDAQGLVQEDPVETAQKNAVGLGVLSSAPAYCSRMTMTVKNRLVHLR